MYIKSIRAKGFKSFAEKLEIDFSDGICAIVGPNGSGKSNVVDAILWVLGEQSVKQLRGDAGMSDVIFSGSKTRDEAKKASVAITFDNSDHMIPSDFTEIEVKREIYSTGENEYFINNAKVRLKDITDLLIDVTSKFNIITQGNITALVDNKSSERRVLFESAAGVLKYKKRKEEALKKLDGTKENLTRVNLIIKELSTSLEPLEKQKADAEKYLAIKKDLEDVEISLLANDITTYTEKYDNLKLLNEKIQKELDQMDKNEDDTLEKMKLENLKLDEEISQINKDLITLSNEIAEANSQKQITLERAKFASVGEALNEKLLSLNEEKLSSEKNISILSSEIEKLKTSLSSFINDYNIKSDEEIKTKVKISNLNSELNKINSHILELQNKIEIEKRNLENSAFLPKSVSNVINNPRLKGIHNTIGNIIDISDTFKIAIDTALSASANFIITDNMESAKSAISFLKEEKLGRATFFPIDTIKSRYMAKDTISLLEKEKGFLGIASDLVKYDDIYKDIIENQLGNVCIVNNMDNLSIIAKKIDYKYKMVSLDGEVLFPGGALAGGTSKNTYDKNNINKLQKELLSKRSEYEEVKNSLSKEESKYEIFTNDLNNLNNKIAENRIIIETKEKLLDENNTTLKDIINSINGLDSTKKGKTDDYLNEIITNLSLKQKEKELKENFLKECQGKKFDLTSKISELEKKINEENLSYHKKENEIKNNEIEIGKYEVRIDNMLSILSSDYNMTYEYALNNYELSLDIDIARSKVSKLKGEIKHLNNVNVGAIDEYNRLKKRYDFLDKQRNDLESSREELLSIIFEMDDIMISKFKNTFDSIAKEFSKVFRIMFKGGNGLLKLTDENDLLNTGINIMAVPPGKKLNSTASLSGGEKSLTAICLIFAILNVKPAPFIVLDEVEAALDEENVNMFGDYLKNMRGQSQFILITHKKKMMEYADVLYGVTMQESGVSKLVSVKLEDA